MDKLKLDGVNLVWDIEKIPLPFENNKFDEIYASNILEHVENLIELMNELHRISRDHAIIKIKVPYFTSKGAFEDTTHKRFFTYKSLEVFTEKCEGNLITPVRFRIKKRWLKFTRKNWGINLIIEFFVNALPLIYERFFCFIFPMHEIYIELEVLK